MEKLVCSKPYCKAPFTFEPEGEDFVRPSVCPKCQSQEDSVVWEDKTYEGERWDGTPHQFSYKIRKFI